MSKAFTKEQDDQLEPDFDLEQDELEAEEDGAPIGSGKNYITPQGAARLRGELHSLLTVERPKVVDTVAWAASNGDRSENADYIYGKRRLREIDSRIRFLQKRLDIAEVVDPAQQKGPKVLFGATVTVRDEDGATKVYVIVGSDETNASKGHISWNSPVGKALLQSEVEDVVTLKSPKGEEELEVIKIEYKAL